MSNVTVTIKDVGMLALVVDAGRCLTMQEVGFCVSGAADIRSYHLVNWLCGDPRHSATFEVIGTFSFSVSDTCTIAVGGPDLDLQINDTVATPWQTQQLNAGDTVRVTPARLGTRSYIGIAGKWALPFVGESQSIVVREQAGGLGNEGKPLKADDEIVVDTLAAATHTDRHLEAGEIPDYSLDTPLDMIPGYQAHTFEGWQLPLFLDSEYEVTNQIDRMGYRLKGQPIEPQISTMHSEGINFGAIQLPPDGQPIVMMSDRQTLGGYPKIGCVAEYDIYRLAQAVPGDIVTFARIDIDNARAKWLLRNRLDRQLFEGEQQL